MIWVSLCFFIPAFVVLCLQGNAIFELRSLLHCRNDISRQYAAGYDLDIRGSFVPNYDVERFLREFEKWNNNYERNTKLCTYAFLVAWFSGGVFLCCGVDVETETGSGIASFWTVIVFLFAYCFFSFREDVTKLCYYVLRQYEENKILEDSERSDHDKVLTLKSKRNRLVFWVE